MSPNPNIPPGPALPPSHDIQIATPNDLPYLHRLQKIWGKNLGYLHKAILHNLIDARCAWTIDHNTQDAGYMLIYPRKSGILRVVQLAIEPELLRTTLGTQLMETLITAAAQHGATTIRLESRQDLHANDFWPTLGFTHTATTRSKNPNIPLKLEWTLPLQSALILPPPISVPTQRTIDTSIEIHHINP